MSGPAAVGHLVRRLRAYISAAVSSTAQPSSNLSSAITSNTLQSVKAARPAIPTNDAIDELEHQLGQFATLPFETRLATIKTLTAVLFHYRLDHTALKVIWECVSPSLIENQQKDSTHALLELINAMIETHAAELQSLREPLFLACVGCVEASGTERVMTVSKLVSKGADLSQVERLLAPFLIFETTSLVGAKEISHSYVMVLMSFIAESAHHASAHFDALARHHLLLNICNLCAQCIARPKTSDSCLQALRACQTAGWLDQKTVQPVVSALCRTVNSSVCNNASWNCMRSLLRGDLGWEAMQAMRTVLEDPENASSPDLLRGAVFFVSMTIWGTSSIEKYAAVRHLVLMSLRRVLDHRNSIVVHELALSLRRLVRSYGHELSTTEWGTVLEILEMLRKDTQLVEAIWTIVEGILEPMEARYLDNTFNGSTAQFMAVVRLYRHQRPDPIVFALVQHAARELLSSTKWLDGAHQFMGAYILREHRPSVQAQALSVLLSLVSHCRSSADEERMFNILLEAIEDVTSEDVVQNANALMPYIIDAACQCSNASFQGIIAVIERLAYGGPCAILAAHGLVQIFELKLFHLPASHACTVFTIMLRVLRAHQREATTEVACEIRRILFQSLMLLHADSQFRIRLSHPSIRKRATTTTARTGLAKHSSSSTSMNQVRFIDWPPLYSPYVLCRRTETGETALHGHAFGTLVMPELLDCICVALQYETSLQIFQVVSEGLLLFLENWYLLSGAFVNLPALTGMLCTMIPKGSFGACVSSAQAIGDEAWLKRHQLAIQLLGTALGYQHLLSTNDNAAIVKCFEQMLGVKNETLAARSASALEACACLVPKEVRAHMPQVLQRLESSAATVNMSTPTLQLMMMLARLPRHCGKFTAAEYKSALSIALRFGDSSKFTDFTVGLSHRVAITWFARCPLRWRLQFVSQMIDTLVLFEKRIDESAPTSRPTHSAPANIASSQPSHVSAAVEEDHVTNVQTVADLIQRLTLSDDPPQQLSLTDDAEAEAALIRNGVSRSWFISGRVVTVRADASSGWARIVIRRPASKISWLMRVRAGNISSSMDSEGVASMETVTAAEGLARVSSQVDSNWYPANQLVSAVRALAQQTSAELAAGPDASDKKNSNGHSSPPKPVLTTSSHNSPSPGSPIRRADSEDAVLDDRKNALKPDEWGSSGGRFRSDSAASAAFGTDRTSTSQAAESYTSQTSFDPLPSYEHASDVEGAAVVLSPAFVLPLSSPRRESAIVEETATTAGMAGMHPEFSTASGSSTVQRFPLTDSPVRTKTPPVWSSESRQSSIQSTGGGDVSSALSINVTDIPSTRLSTLPAWGETGAAGSRLSQPPLAIGSRLSNPPTSSLHTEEARVDSPHETGGIVRAHTPLLVSQSSFPDLPRAPSTDPTSAAANAANVAPINPLSAAALPSTIDHLAFRNTDSIASDADLFPSLIFMHIQALQMPEAVPKLLQEGPGLERALAVFDRIAPCDCHKIAVLYISIKQVEELEILSNEYGSVRYTHFLQTLGAVVNLKGFTEYTGGLDVSSDALDGIVAYWWQDAITQMIFHVASMMPNRESDPKRNGKKLHLGNDYVSIVYKENPNEYDINTVKGEFNYVAIIVEPLHPTFNHVYLQTIPDLRAWADSSVPVIIHDSQLGGYVRQLALHANQACLELRAKITSQGYTSNWMERLRQIRRIESRLTRSSGSEVKSAQQQPQRKTYDFSYLIV